MPKPKILCLHGGGSNARIFEAQLARLNMVLRPHFDLVCADGPLECDAGPGILPFFDGEEPFRQWFCPSDAKEQNAAHTQQMAGLRGELLRVVGEKGPFVGVLGFSQGARTAASLLLLQEERPEGVGIKFGVFACGTVPPEDLLLDQRGEGGERAKTVRVPTVHVFADSDPWRPQSEKLPDYCDPEKTRIFQFKGGHHLPTIPAENQKMADLILEVYRQVEERA